MSSPAQDPAVEIVGLEKRYSSGLFRRAHHTALKGITLRVPRGEVFGYLGPNGAGKTTTLKILMGLVFADAGEVRILGHPLECRAWRYHAGYTPEHPYFYDYLTSREYLAYAGRLLGLPAELVRDRTQELLALVGLTRSIDVPLRRFSKGMVQRLGLAQALINDPELLFLDEPMSGLDPIGRRMVRDVILRLRERGKTVFFSTHILSDAETLCDRIAVLRAGELLTAGRLDEILDLDVSHVELVVSGLAAAELDRLDLPPEARVLVGERACLRVPEARLGSLVLAVEQAGGRVVQAQQVRQSLEDYFFKELGGVPGSELEA